MSKYVPMESRFLWLNLAVPDPMYILPILVVITTWLQQKLLTPSTPSSGGRGDEAADQAAAMTRQMTTIMPIMFGIFALSFASGLSIYFIASNLIGIGQYAALGRIDIKSMLGLGRSDEEQTESPKGKAKSKPKPKAKQEAPATSSNTKTETEKPATQARKAGRTPARIQNSSRKKRSGVYDSRLAHAETKSKAKG
jgi:membrane protein insertase Oxa1/YidC/SpoIIIJ